MADSGIHAVTYFFGKKKKNNNNNPLIMRLSFGQAENELCGIKGTPRLSVVTTTDTDAT